MPYIGRGSDFGVRSRFIYTATAGQTSFSGNDDAGISLAYTDTLYMDVYQNGVLLVPATDYAASTGTSVVLVQGASVDDTLELLVHDIFSVADSVSAKDGGTFSGTIAAAGYSSSTAGTSNYIAGVNAGNSITAGGNFNTVVGDEAGTAITTGDNNTALGHRALDACSTSVSNVAIGNDAGGAVTTGNGENVFVGNRAGLGVTTGQQNIIIGDNACANGTMTGNLNVFIGDNAGLVNTTGADNTAVGGSTLGANTTGHSNVAVGKGAIGACVDGEGNTAVGFEALLTEDSGSKSTAIGHRALRVQDNAASNHNTAVGYDAGLAITSGVNNVIIGALTGDALTTGQGNTLLGHKAGTHEVNLQSGNNNTIVGAFCDTTAVDTSTAACLGHNLDAAGGFTTLGDGTDDIRAAHGNTTWATVSDERVKKDITDSTAGLSFINDLRPRTFKYKNKGDLPKDFKGYEEGSTEAYKNSNTNHGFIAQEVKAVIDSHSEITDGFRMWDVKESGQQQVGEAAVIPILVKALQELSEKNDALESRLAALEAK